MNRPFKTMSALLAALAILSAAALSIRASPAQPAPQTIQSIPGGPPAILLAGQGQQQFRIAPPESIQLHTQSTVISVNYLSAGTSNAFGYACQAWPDNARAAFDYAASIWASLLNSSVPIKINACWTTLGSGVLGLSGPETYHQGTFGSPNTWYPVALANARSGNDLNDYDGMDWDKDGEDADAEIESAYSNSISWYFGTDGNTPMGQYDFASVVLHEICHGLGFLGSMHVSNGLGYWGISPNNTDPIIYDRFTENGAGVPLLNFSNGSTALAAQLQGGDLYFNGSNARAANGDNRPKLFAPSTWMPGSSYVHLDEIYNNTENALMTYSLNNGEAIHNPGPITRGILRDIGWQVSEPAANVCIVKRVSGPVTLHASDRVTFTLAIANAGNIVATHVVITDAVPPQVLSPEFASTLAITPTGSFSYVWNVESLAPGRSGVITISGQVSPVLTAPFALSNTAIIWSPEDNTPEDNYSSATVVVNGRQTYLPTVMRGWPPIPDTPELVAITNPDGDGTFTVRWKAASRAVIYTLEEDDSASFSSPTTVYFGTAVSTTVTNRPLGIFYYRVKAANSWGESGWSAVQSVEVSVFSEDFEGAFPAAWHVFDNNGTTYGEYFWGKRICRPWAGEHSGWAVGGGVHGAGLGCGSLYPHNAQSWMIYGPFSLSDAHGADLRFKLWLYSQPDSEGIPHDRACWMASVDGNYFSGFCTSGNTGGWSDYALDLTQVPNLGNLTGRSQVWIALIFVSDNETTYAEGAYVDNITLRRYNTPPGSGSAGTASASTDGAILALPAAMTRGEP